MVSVKQGAQANITKLSQLGLTSEAVHVIPVFRHMDIHTDDYGPEVPAEIMWMLAEVRIDMILAHYDQAVLSQCIQESMAGGTEGTLTAAGTPMGAFFPVGQAGCHFISLNIDSPIAKNPWRFKAAYLAEQPVDIPLSTERSLTKLRWRAIPYQPKYTSALLPSNVVNPETTSSGVVLWDHVLDT